MGTISQTPDWQKFKTTLLMCYRGYETMGLLSNKKLKYTLNK